MDIQQFQNQLTKKFGTKHICIFRCSSVLVSFFLAVLLFGVLSLLLLLLCSLVVLLVVERHNFSIKYIEEDHRKSHHTSARAASVDYTVESIHRLADIVARFGADKEHIARESIEKNKFHFLNANADRIRLLQMGQGETPREKKN